MIARFSVTSNGLAVPRWIRSLISLLTGPRILATASLSDMPLTGSLSMATIRSPGLMPALAAGVSSIGDTTLTMLFSMVTSMPSPPNSPRTCTSMSPKFLAFM